VSNTEYWVTGVKGLVGSTLASRLQESCVGTGREVDIADERSVNKWIETHPHLTHILNCAAFSQVDPAEEKREEAYLANAIGPEVLGRVAQKKGLSIVHLSTDYVFSGEGVLPLRETDPTGPCNYYGETKLEGERRLLAECPGATVLRTSWVFGKGGKNFVAKLLELLQTRESLRMVADQKGRPTYAPDLGEVMLRLVGRSGLYQFANAGVTSKYEFALTLREEMRARQIPIQCTSIQAAFAHEFSSAAKRPLYSAFDTTKVEEALRMKPRVWKEALKEFIDAAV
jgi:dTDP-4-dehydrorhamnose reductase